MMASSKNVVFQVKSYFKLCLPYLGDAGKWYNFIKRTPEKMIWEIFKKMEPFGIPQTMKIYRSKQ